MGETESKGSSVAIWQDHILPVDQRWERWGQLVVLQLSSKITYILWIGDRRDGVSWWFCSYLVRSRTICGSAMGEIESAGSFAAIQHDHVHSVDRQWERVSRQFCSHPA